MKIINLNSIKTRVILFTLLTFLLCNWGMTLYISHMLTEDMLAQVSKLQYTNVTLLADHLDEEFLDRLSNLKERARIIHQEDIADPELLNRRLQKEAVFLRHFNGGAFITDIEGTAIASFPVSAGRIGVNYMFRDQIASALKDGKSAVSRVVVGKQLHAPVVSMATPVRDKQGTIVGALVGTINLAQPNFLDKVSNSDYGDTGGYLVIAKGQRIIISASDKSRIMEALPEPGSNQIIDRFFGGYRGSDVIFNPAGKAMLVSAAPIPSADWMVISLQPTAEAFAPIRALQERMLIAAFVLTLLTLVIMWMVLRRQLQPVVNTSRKLALMVKGDQPLEPLPVESMDEVGALIGGFNQLLTTLEDREAQIRSFYEFDIVGLTITSPEKGWLRINHSLCNMLEYSEQELRGMTWVELTHPDDLAADIEQFNRLLANEIEGYSLEKRFVSKTGKVIPTQLVVRCVRKSNGDVDYITAMVQDISDRKAAEKAIANLAYFDPLTQLPNRRLLMDRFHTALLGSTRNHLHGAVLFIDMDKFKTINDTLGHNYGDLMLIQVARRIHSCVRDVDTVSRFGGDEFVVILEDIDDSCKTASQKISLIAEKIRLVLTEPYQLNGAEYVCSPSIGISVYCGNAESADVLLKQADMAMYQAKDSGRNSIRFFDPAMQLAVVTRAALESDLRQAV